MRRLLLDLALTSAILAATLGASRWSENRKAESLAMPLAQIPEGLGDWTAYRSEVLPERVEQTLAATAYFDRGYRRPGRSLDVFIAYYAAQHAGESMHSPKNCLPGNGWEIWKYGTADVQVGSRLVKINQFGIQANGSKALVFYWYQTRDRILADEYLGKAFMVWDAIAKGRTAGSIVRIILPDQPGAVADGLNFASALIPQVEMCLGRQF